MSGYLGVTPVPQATQTRQTFTATASQTSFATGGYQAGYLDVFLNGVKLVDGTDYTATNGSDVVLTTGAASGDTLEVVAYTAFEVLNQNFTGTTTVTDSGAAPLVANRTTSDGVITVFQKDGSTVGSINSRASAVSSIVLDPRSGQGAGITGGGKTITPTNESGSNVDADIDLGQSVNRWKDLYLSGGVYLGGTGSANKLDDYETGTFTPVLTGDVTAPTLAYTRRDGYYTKVGNLVHCNIYVQTSVRTGGSGTLRILGLPFTSLNAAAIEFYGHVLAYRVSASGRSQFDCNTTPNTAQLTVLGGGDNIEWSAVPITAWNDGTTAMRISISYRVS